MTLPSCLELVISNCMRKVYLFDYYDKFNDIVQMVNHVLDNIYCNWSERMISYWIRRTRKLWWVIKEKWFCLSWQSFQAIGLTASTFNNFKTGNHFKDGTFLYYFMILVDKEQRYKKKSNNFWFKVQFLIWKKEWSLNSKQNLVKVHQKHPVWCSKCTTLIA